MVYHKHEGSLLSLVETDQEGYDIGSEAQDSNLASIRIVKQAAHHNKRALQLFTYGLLHQVLL
jgi:hypothetical protein